MTASTSGFSDAWKGKIKAAALYLHDSEVNLRGLFFRAGGSYIQQGAVWTNSGAPVNGTSGTLAGYAAPGDLLVRTDTPALYQNTNTLASPTWSAAPVTGVAGITSGTVDGTVIGGSTPAAATVTTLAVSAATALTASTTQTQVGALALTATINNIATCAHSADAVKLPALAVGQFCIVINSGANPAGVWPSTGGNIDGAGANTAVTLTNAKRCIYMCVVTNVIISAQLGLASA